MSVSTDPPDALASAAQQYRVSTPLLSDFSREMSRDYEMFGKGGMRHAETEGHAFMLVDAEGRIAWERVRSEVYVSTEELLDQLPK